MKAYLTDLLTFIGKDIAEVVLYLNPVFILLPAGLLLVLYAAGRRKGRDGTAIRYFVKVSFGLGYCLVLLVVTLLSRESGSRTGVDLLPFATVGHGAQGDAYVVENVLLFMPLGVLAGWFFPAAKRAGRVVGAGFILSLLIEVTQYLTGCGYAQTDDLIMNTIGTWIGFGGYAWIRRIVSGSSQRAGTEPEKKHE